MPKGISGLRPAINLNIQASIVAVWLNRVPTAPFGVSQSPVSGLAEPVYLGVNLRIIHQLSHGWMNKDYFWQVGLISWAGRHCMPYIDRKDMANLQMYIYLNVYGLVILLVLGKKSEASARTPWKSPDWWIVCLWLEHSFELLGSWRQFPGKHFESTRQMSFRFACALASHGLYHSKIAAAKYVQALADQVLTNILDTIGGSLTGHRTGQTTRLTWEDQILLSYIFTTVYITLSDAS